MAAVPAAFNRKGEAAASGAALLELEAVERYYFHEHQLPQVKVLECLTVAARPSELRALPTIRAERRAERANIMSAVQL